MERAFAKLLAMIVSGSASSEKNPDRFVEGLRIRNERMFEWQGKVYAVPSAGEPIWAHYLFDLKDLEN